MCARAQARATPEKGDSLRVVMIAHFEVRTFEVQTLIQVVYRKQLIGKPYGLCFVFYAGSGFARLCDF